MSSRDRVRFAPLCASSADEASCFLLEIGDCRLLLDCGWSEPYDVEQLALLKEVAPSVHVVLLSHADPAYTAALPYAVAHFGLKATLLCTHPISKMGQMFLYDTVISRQAMENFDQMSLDEIDGAFSQLTALKYNQEFIVEEFGLVISARNSGRTVGAAAWLISKDVYNIVYAVDYSHQRDKQAYDCQVVPAFCLNCAMFVVGIRHLNGFQFEAFQKPTLLITDSKHIEQAESDHEERNAALLWTALQAVRNGGHVLIPTDTAGRVLELILLFEDYWLKNKCMMRPVAGWEWKDGVMFRLEFALVFLGPVSFSTVSFASCQLEWMQSSITDAFEKDRDNPFDCRCLRFCNTREDYEKIGEEPKVVLASHASLQAGFARQLAIEWMEDEKNRILLTVPPKMGSLAHLLLERAVAKSTEKIDVAVSRRVPLTGEELEEYEAEKEKQRNAMVSENTEMAIDEKSEGSSMSISLDDSGLDKQAHGQATDALLSKSTKITKQLSLEVEEHPSETRHFYFSGVLIDGFHLPELSTHPLFPSEETALPEWSVYGEVFDSSNLFPALPNQEEPSLLGSAPMLMEEEVKELPTKIVTECLSLSPLARVEVFDMSGSTNRHFMQHFLSYIQPRTLILVNGSEATHDGFQQIARASCSQLRLPGRILCPKSGEKVELEGALSNFEITLNKDIMKNAHWQQTGHMQLAWIRGQLQQPDPSKEEFQLEPAEQEGHVSESLYVGDRRLSHIRNALRAKQLETEFAQGCLICDKNIRIRLDASRSLVIEGPISLTYYLVRKTVDEMYKIK